MDEMNDNTATTHNHDDVNEDAREMMLLLRSRNRMRKLHDRPKRRGWQRTGLDM